MVIGSDGASHGAVVVSLSVGVGAVCLCLWLCFVCFCCFRLTTFVVEKENYHCFYKGQITDY